MPHEILKPTFERNDARGQFQEVLTSGTWESLIRGRMKAGAAIGDHYHEKTTIFFYLSSGSARVRTIHVETGRRDDFSLAGGQGVMLSVKESHLIRFLEESEFIMLKSLRYNPADPDTFSFPVED
jgi:hypothetical protein